jgi:hypothetical protein
LHKFGAPDLHKLLKISVLQRVQLAKTGAENQTPAGISRLHPREAASMALPSSSFILQPSAFPTRQPGFLRKIAVQQAF